MSTRRPNSPRPERSGPRDAPVTAPSLPSTAGIPFLLRAGALATVLFLAGSLVACGGDAESRELPDQGSLAGAQPGNGDWADPPAPPPEPVRALSAGTRLTFEMTQTISTSSHSAGDTFELRLLDEVRGSGGLVLPVGTRARGVIMESQPSRDADQEAVLAVRIQSVELNGNFRDIPGTVESASTRASTGDSGTRTAAKVATGAAAGAVLGQVLGRDTRSTVTGAAAGAAAGVGVALTTRTGHATLEDGARVTVRLDRDLVVR
jgi:hypothetical protein